jgi:hypothetical protein
MPVVQIGGSQEFRTVQLEHLGQDQAADALAHDQHRCSLIDFRDIYGMQDAGKNLDKAGIDEGESGWNDLDVEWTAHNIFGKCAPDVAACDLVTLHEAFDVWSQLVDDASDFVP